MSPDEASGSPAVEASRPHKAAAGRPCRQQGALCSAAPGVNAGRGTPDISQISMAGSSARAFTLAAKPIAAYHFIAFSAEARGTWRLCHARAGPRQAGGRGRQHAGALPWFQARRAPTFAGTDPSSDPPYDSRGASRDGAFDLTLPRAEHRRAGRAARSARDRACRGCLGAAHPRRRTGDCRRSERQGEA